MPVWYWGVGADTRESSVLFDTPTACFRPTGSEVKTKALSGEQLVAMGWLFQVCRCAPRNGALRREV
jgi:hypothetical protein